MILLLAAISLAPVLGSLLLFYFWKPQSFTNYGQLLPATPLAGTSVAQSGGSAFRIDELHGDWIFLMADAGECDEYCRSKLYLMRQIRLTQGDERRRIERVWIVTDGVQPSAQIEAEYRGTRIVMAADTQFVSRLPAPASPRDHIYLVDPFGNLMMRFPRNADPQRMKKDVARLIKISGGWIQPGK
ncbi:MAG TPA: cytochrome C oxidase subunit I [Burkholderiales bacterium]|nr:cytochrome C oxidase subunit I [Burkholderiales bacterium]